MVPSKSAGSKSDLGLTYINSRKKQLQIDLFFFHTLQSIFPIHHRRNFKGISMVLKLYGNSVSPNARLVAAILLEKEVSFEFVEVDWSAIKSPKYLHLQPFGQLPCIVRETHGPPYRTMLYSCSLLLMFLYRMMTDLFSTKAKRSVIISHPSIPTKEPHYFQLNSKPTHSSIKPYQ